MATDRDEWGHDPSVQTMRRVFKYMESAQDTLLGQLNLSPFDERLRKWREVARDFFERLWPLALERGIVSGEEEAAVLYIHCLVRMLASGGVKAPGKALPGNERISKFLREVLP